jgi:hypothetical protein
MGETIMNLKSIIFTSLLGACSMLATRSFAQTDSVRVNKEKQEATEINERNTERLKTAVQSNETLQGEARKSEGEKNQNRLKDAENLQKDNKARSKEANRISRDASDAAKESKSALKAERKAQKSRVNADKHANKAAKATEKSNGN